MKKLFLYALVASVALVACSKKDTADTKNNTDTKDPKENVDNKDVKQEDETKDAGEQKLEGYVVDSRKMTAVLLEATDEEISQMNAESGSDYAFYMDAADKFLKSKGYEVVKTKEMQIHFKCEDGSVKSFDRKSDGFEADLLYYDGKNDARTFVGIAAIDGLFKGFE